MLPGQVIALPRHPSDENSTPRCTRRPWQTIARRAWCVVAKGALARAVRFLPGAWQMFHVAVVLVADGFHEFRIGQQAKVLGEGPSLRIRLGIIDRDLDVHVAEVLPAIPLGDLQSVGYRLALLIDPEVSVETLGMDNQHIAVPLAG